MNTEKQNKPGPLYVAPGHLNMRRVVREIVSEYLKDEDLAPTNANVAKRMNVTASTLYNQVSEGGFSEATLTSLIATIGDGDPIAFFMRHPEVRERHLQLVLSAQAVGNIERKTREVLIARLQESV